MSKWFSSREIPLRSVGHGKKEPGEQFAFGAPKMVHVFYSQLTPTEVFNRCRELQSEQRHHPFRGGNWIGTGTQPINDIIQRGIIDEAVKAFERAAGNLDTHYARATPELRVVGSAFSIGRVMTNHPKSAIYRPKTKLPPKQIDVTLNAWCGLSAEDIAASMAKMAKAAWSYIAAGGIVDLRVSYLHKFSRPQLWNGIAHHGFLDTVKINPINAAAFASAASGQMYRGLSMPIALALSGDPSDGLPLCKWGNPSTVAIQGNAADARAWDQLKLRDAS